MTEEFYSSLDSIEDCINRLLAVRDVVSLNTLPNEEIVKLIDAMVNLFSDKQKIVWDEYRKQQEMHSPDFAKHYRQLTNDYIELETKYKKLALYDTRDQQIEDLTKENTYLIRQIEEIKANNTFGINNEEFEKINNHIKELTIQKEYYKDQANLFRNQSEHWEEKYSIMEADYNNFVKTVRTVSQHPSHD